MKNPLMPSRRRSRAIFSATLIACLASPISFAADAHAAPGETPGEKSASTIDSDARKWSGIDGTRYGDSIRKTSRITYPDAGRVPQISCNVIGDMRTDMIFLDQKKRKIHIVDHIPYGSDQDDLVRSISNQPGAIHIDLPAGEGDWHIGCVKRARGENPVLAVANKNKVFISGEGKLTDGAAFPVASTYTFTSDVLALAPLTSGLDTPGMLVAADGNAYLFNSIQQGNKGPDSASKSWQIGDSQKVNLVPLNYTLAEDVTIGVGLPGKNVVYAISANAESGKAADVATTIQANGGEFGTSMVSIGDINGDDMEDYAIGAPNANGNTGAVAIIYGSKNISGTVKVDVSSVSQTPVTRDSKAAGTLIRQANRGRIGTSLAYVPQYDADNPGALVISRPKDEEHPGAVAVSEKALNKNWNTGSGLDSIPGNQAVILASEEGDSGDGGFYVGTIPAADSDKDLTGIFTVDTKGKVDVWTVDMRRQNETTPPAKPLYPPPPAPSAKPAYKPINEADQKSWLGEFTSGLGGSIAKGTCDVTGDGKADLISGNATRSEYKFDPYYEDSTPTHGWVFNVTGQIQIIPGGTPGGTTEGNNKIINILGPKKTQNPAADAAVGFSVACLGDVNGDGIDDIAASSVTMGRVWVIYGGKDLALTDLNALEASRGYIVDMPHEMGAAGYQVSRVGDVDGDGRADLGFVVSNTPLAMGDRSQTYGSAFIVKGQAQGKTVNLQDLNAPNSDVIWRVNTPQGHTLNAFTPVGDVNGDGIGDYVLSDFNSFTDKATVPGVAWVVYGTKDFRSVDLRNPAHGYEISMSTSASYRLGAGNSIAPAGDVNGDGIGDFVIGFDGGSIQHQSEGGVALVLGTKEQVSKRTIDPAEAGKTDKNIRVITGASKESGFGWATDTIPVSSANPHGLLAIGAGGQGANGAAYVLRLTDIPEGITSVTALGSKVNVLNSTGERSRFGRSVAFIGNYLDQPTLAVGGDGVIDNPAAGEEGYAHSAHILAMAAHKVTPAVENLGNSSGKADDPAGASKDENGGKQNAGKHGKANKPGSKVSTKAGNLPLTGSQTVSLAGLAALSILLGAGLISRRSRKN